MLTRQFWLGETGAIVRAIRTAAQTAIATIGIGQTNLMHADLKNVLALSCSSAVLSVLMSLDRNTEQAVEIIEVSPATYQAAAEPIPDPDPPSYQAVDPAMPARIAQPLGFTPTHGCGESLR